MTRKRPLTPEEKLLWKHITRNDKPLRTVIVDKEDVDVEEKLEVSQPKQRSLVKPKNTKPAVIEKAVASQAGERKLGDYAGIDKNTAERFRKGEASIDARLDLHGMTQEKAHNLLVAFINKQIKLENRRLLVITGKGSGILRAALPNWLTASELSRHVLAFDMAKPKHGGEGAYYILLKRKRK